jgi:hypothetical protein
VTKINPIIPPVADEAGVIKVWPFSQNPDGSLSPSSSAGPSSNVNIEYLQGAAPALTNPLPVELSDGTQAIGTAGNPLSVDVISGGGSNASVGADNALAPTSDTLIGTVDAGGKLQAVSAANPLPISGSISASNPSVGTDNATAPTSATEIGSIDGGGKLQGASTTNPIPVALPTATVTTLTPPTAAAIGAACPVPPTAAAIGAACPVPPTAAAIGAACPVPPTAAAIGAACPVPPTAADIAAAIVSNPPTTFGGAITGTVSAKLEDGSGNAITSTASALDVNLKSGLSNPLPVHDSSPASQAVTNVGTFAVQDSAAEISLASIVSALTNPLPVSLPAGTITTLTPPTAAAIGAACPVPPTAAAIAGAIVSNPPTISIASAQKVEVYDGTNTAAVKAASTAAADGDTSLVVQLNPKQPNLDTALNVHDASPASQAVTNTGTFAVQEATLDGCISLNIVAVHDASPASQAVTNVGTFAVQAACSGTVTTTPPSHASTNVDQLAGTTVDTNSGNKSAGTLRVVVATDQPNLTTALNVHDASPSSVAVTNTGTFATQDSNLSGCISASKVAVSIAAMPSTAVTNTGTFAVQEATIDGCIAAGVVAVHDSSPASQAVTNTGTFAVQATTKTALTPAAPTATSVGITSASAVAANASRKGLVLTNTSGGTISLGFGSAAVLNSGITLSSGGSFEMDEYTFYAGAVYAIASGAASNLAIQEYST